MRPRFRFSIRSKLVLLSIAILSVPYVGFQYLRETERYLQSSLEGALTAIAGALAISLQSHAQIFTTAGPSERGLEALFVHALNHPIQVDGYSGDWNDYLDWADHFPPAQTGAQRAGGGPAFRLLLGEHGRNLYILLQVDDRTYDYQRDNAFAPRDADTIEILISDDDRKLQRYFFGTASPGTVTAYRIIENWDFTTSRQAVANIVGEWQEADSGYVLEIRIPLVLIGNRMSIAVYDLHAEQPTRTNSAIENQITLNRLLRTSAQLEQLIERVGLTSGRRVWILNRSGQVLASGGTLVSEVKRGAINFIYTWILPAASDSFEDDRRAASRLRGAEVLRALSGEAATRWRSSPDERAVIVSAGYPIRVGNEVVGAVVVEETTNSIQTLQRDAMADLFNRSIAVFLLVTLFLLFFASRLTIRLTRLRDETELAIDTYGRVVGDIEASRANDEIGDLSRSYAAMLRRLKEYNAYLETMGGKLSHEIRTPLAVVSSSFENLLAAADDDERERYIARAQEGLARLQNLVRRLGEAARLEQSIAGVELECFDLAELVRTIGDGYAQAYPQHKFRLDCPAGPIWIDGSPDLIAQLLDKLVENALDFCDPGTAVSMRLHTYGKEVLLEVENQGARLPETAALQLFDSMVSVRGGNRSDRPHLGLGLYIVRLIAEHHGASVSAENVGGSRAVVFRVVFPLRDPVSDAN